METILIQETDAATLEVLTFALQMEGYRVRSLTDNNENILGMIRRHRPELVLLDCRLGHYTGKQISHWIKAHFPRLPVIAFSCDNNIGEEYRRLGFDGYLKKPFDLEVLYRQVRKYLPKRRKHQMADRPNAMTAVKKRPAPELKTEGPLSEKDQQGMAAERAGKLGQEALEQWRGLKDNIVRTFKK